MNHSNSTTPEGAGTSKDRTSHPASSTAVFATDKAKVVSELGSNATEGLSNSQVENQRGLHGWNELATVAAESSWIRFFRQFTSLVVWILIAAAVISGAVGDWTDTAIVVAIILLNALLGFFQEERAERALAALQGLATPMARVVREGHLTSIPARELVTGDIVAIESGDHVPADLRLLKAFALQVLEASLTGESVPVEKDADASLPATTPLADRTNMVYMSTIVANGQAQGIVTAIGMQTEIGRIAGLLQTTKREQTPLQRRLEELGRVLVTACLVLVGLIFVMGLWRGRPLLETLLSAVSLAVAAVPEGLPAVVTITLAVGLERMARRNALIRKLPSVETLGCVSVICSDKTGTLTRNEMTVREAVIGEVHYKVTGTGYAPQGEFIATGPGPERTVNPAEDEDLRLMLQTAHYCNHAQIQQGDNPDSWKVVGDPTEGALVTMAMKGGIASDERRPEPLEELPFDSKRKLMSVMVPGDAGQAVQFTKGALEGLLARCVDERLNNKVSPLSDERRHAITQSQAQMASRSLRVLAFGIRHDSDPPKGIDENGLTFVGLVGMIDPPRDEVKHAVARCESAGIRPVMITGDHPDTAIAIGRELGIAASDDQAVKGQDVETMSDDDLAANVEKYVVYARVAPEHKLRIIRAWQKRNHVVAMTGDGVNDAPAVKAADIGIAMGITGTDVTREAASMVLLDDNFTSIVNAVEEGRAIYDNILKFLIFLLSCNVAEMLIMFLASVIGWPPPLLPIHLMWINLVTDGLPALALAMEPPEKGIMHRSPRSSDESIISRNTGMIVVFQGLLLAAVGLIVFMIIYVVQSGQLEHARAVTFSVVVFGELFRALSARSRKLTLWQLGLFTNPYILGAVVASALLQIAIVSIPPVHGIFGTVSHSLMEWGLIVGVALIPAAVIEIAKLISQSRPESGQPAGTGSN